MCFSRDFSCSDRHQMWILCLKCTFPLEAMLWNTQNKYLENSVIAAYINVKRQLWAIFFVVGMVWSQKWQIVAQGPVVLWEYTSSERRNSCTWVWNSKSEFSWKKKFMWATKSCLWPWLIFIGNMKMAFLKLILTKLMLRPSK